MKTYRIKEYDYGVRKSYLVQRRSIFGFWYNEDNVDATQTGWFDNLKEALDWIKIKTTKARITIIV